MDTSTVVLTKEQYTTRKIDMERLRKRERWSLQQIADAFGVSRQRVSQILGKDYVNWRHGKFQDTLRDPEWLEEHAMLTNDEVAELLGASYGSVNNYRRHCFHMQKGYHGRNAIWTMIIKKTLKNRFDGLSVELLPNIQLGNMSVTGDKATANILVRVSDAAKNLPYSLNPMFSFNLVKRVRLNGIADFIICVIEPTDDLFVIPAGLVGEQERINMVWPTSWAVGKWQKYHDRFDLIAEFCNN